MPTRADSSEYSWKSAREFGESSQNGLANVSKSGESGHGILANLANLVNFKLGRFMYKKEDIFRYKMI
jgi:hypothetical protein